MEIKWNSHSVRGFHHAAFQLGCQAPQYCDVAKHDYLDGYAEGLKEAERMWCEQNLD